MDHPCVAAIAACIDTIYMGDCEMRQLWKFQPRIELDCPTYYSQAILLVGTTQR